MRQWSESLGESGELLWCGTIPDLDGDGIEEIGLSLNEGRAGFRDGYGRARLLIRSGRTGDLIREILGDTGSFAGDVIVMGDLNSDGLRELLICDYRAARNGPLSGHVRIVSPCD